METGKDDVPAAHRPRQGVHSFTLLGQAIAHNDQGISSAGSSAQEFGIALDNQVDPFFRSEVSDGANDNRPVADGQIASDGVPRALIRPKTRHVDTEGNNRDLVLRNVVLVDEMIAPLVRAGNDRLTHRTGKSVADAVPQSRGFETS